LVDAQSAPNGINISQTLGHDGGAVPLEDMLLKMHVHLPFPLVSILKMDVVLRIVSKLKHKL
jgi:hypothetical protein